MLILLLQLRVDMGGLDNQFYVAMRYYVLVFMLSLVALPIPAAAQTNAASTNSLDALVYQNPEVWGLSTSNWPSFRGARAWGLGGGETVTNWNVETSENILWKAAVPGLGHSSPVIWGDRLFITTAVNESKTAPLKVGLYGDPASADDDEVQKWKVICLNKITGAKLWEATAHEGAPKVRRHTKATHANCTVATDGTNVVAFFGSEGLYCYDLDGNLRWKKDLGTLRVSPVVYNDKRDPEGATLEWGFASSPVIYADRVFVQCDVLTNGFVAAFDMATGKEAWRTRRDDTGTWSTPAIVEGPRPQLLVNGWNHMGGYDLRTGAEIWRLAGGGDCPVPTPVVFNKLIYLMSAHGPRSPIYAVRTSAVGDISLHDGATTNEYIAWSVMKGGSYMQTPMVYCHRLYTCGTDGILSCYDDSTGKLLFKERLGTGGEGFTASPVMSRELVYFTSEQGTVFVVLGSAEFKVLATNHLNEVCMATPAISDGVIFFRTQEHVIAVGGRK